jgi:hypothetical protein
MTILTIVAVMLEISVCLCFVHDLTFQEEHNILKLDLFLSLGEKVKRHLLSRVPHKEII